MNILVAIAVVFVVVVALLVVADLWRNRDAYRGERPRERAAKAWPARRRSR